MEKKIETIRFGGYMWAGTGNKGLDMVWPTMKNQMETPVRPG